MPRPLMNTLFPWHLVAPLYQERHRSYHGIRHIHAILREIDALGAREDFQAGFSNIEAYDLQQWLRAVAWLHDAYHDPNAASRSNEARSAELVDMAPFRACFTSLGAHLAREAILATAHHTTDQNIDSAVAALFLDEDMLDPVVGLFLDLDLAHLGGDTEAFIRTSRSVSEEYRRVGANFKQLEAGHVAFASKMLEREKLYYTPFFADREVKARENLELSRRQPQLMIDFAPIEETTSEI